MLYFDFNGYQGFQERFGMQQHGNGVKSRKNKILLAYVKSEFKKKNYRVINFKTMAEMQNEVWLALLGEGYKDTNLLHKVELMDNVFFSDLYETDDWKGICEDHDTRSIRYINLEQGRVFKMKAGKMLHHLINATEYGRNLCEPVQRWMEEDFSQRWQSYCMGKLPENHLIVNTDFSRIYSSDDCVGNFGSCMVNQGHWHFYKDSVEAKAAFLVDSNDMVIARAILWPKVYDDEGNVYRYLDRQYSTDGNVVLMRALIDELIKVDEIDIYKVPGCGCGDATAIVDKEGRSMATKCFHIECNLGTDDSLSYMDTFKWYKYNEGKVYNGGRHGWDYMLDTTSYSIDDDCYDDDDSYDDYHQQYVDGDISQVFVHGEEMYCADDWMEDFHWVDSREEYHHKDDVFLCPECKCWELKGQEHHSDITGKDYCCSECRKTAESNYKQINWYFSDFDQDYYEEPEEITTFNSWNPALQCYLERTISRITLDKMVSMGLMFFFAGEYCNALNPITHKPYTKESNYGTA